MTEQSNGAQHSGPRPARAAHGARRTRDRRRTQIVWVPTYLPEYATRVGANGVTMYLLLARACCYGWEPRWPSLAQLGTMMGVSRSTAERTLRLLRGVGLVETEACYDESGQHSNYWDLTDPFDLREQLDSPGTPAAGAGNPDGAPPSPAMGGDIAGDGGAPSPMPAPPLRSEGVKSVCEEGAHTPSAALTEGAEPGAAVKYLREYWCNRLRGGAPAWREAHRVEIGAHVEALLALGWTAQELVTSIGAPERDVAEWPREWAGRHGPAALQATRKAAETVRARQQRANASLDHAAETARRAALHERYERMSTAERAALEAEALKTKPELASRPGILRLLVLDRLGVEGEAPAPPAAE